MRSQNEFSYGGDASVKRPKLNEEVSDLAAYKRHAQAEFPIDWEEVRDSRLGKFFHRWILGDPSIVFVNNACVGLSAQK